VYGAWDFLGNYLVRTSNLTDADTGITGFAAKSTQLALGVNYNFSKRTSVYARYEALSGLNAKVSAASSVTGTPGYAAFNDAKQTTTVAGVKVLF
jgi:predicted porin